MRQLREVAATQHGLPHQHPFMHHPQRNRSAKNRLQITDTAHTQWKPGRNPGGGVKTGQKQISSKHSFEGVFFSPHGPRENRVVVFFCVTEQLTRTQVKHQSKEGKEEVSLLKCATSALLKVSEASSSGLCLPCARRSINQCVSSFKCGSLMKRRKKTPNNW